MATRTVRKTRKARPAKKKPPRAAAQAKVNARVLYLYGVSQRPAGGRLRAAGVDGRAAIECLRCAPYYCWVSRVDGEEFGDELATHMENLDWLAEASVRHQRAVSEVAQHVTILPARFGTVFLTEESLHQHVHHDRRKLGEAFNRVENADEWGVKVFAVPQTPPPTRAASGKDYLRQKAARLETRARKADPEVQAFQKELDYISLASTDGGKVSSGQRGLLWNASFLIPRSRTGELQGMLARFADRWAGSYRIECSGPWPPYSFVQA
jgi:gas vesicle protein GvpL/GvpF